MKKYTKPSVKVVNLKSSNDIAATSFTNLRNKMIKSYLDSQSQSKEYAVSIYSNTVSNGNGEELPIVEG